MGQRPLRDEARCARIDVTGLGAVFGAQIRLRRSQGRTEGNGGILLNDSALRCLAVGERTLEPDLLGGLQHAASEQ
jgi:hypothetical protein